MKGNNKHHMSLFDNEQECLKSILQIHYDGNMMVDCDPMYFKGNFYKNGVEKSLYRFDINPSNSKLGDGVERADAKALPLQTNSLDSIILDPPFLISNRPSQLKYYSSKTHTFFKDFADLENCYRGILAEAYRTFRKNGLLIFKCQDYTDSKTIITHCFVWRWATELGFYSKDIAILNIPQSKVYNSLTKQRHLRKTHCYFWVFQKKGGGNENKKV